MEGTHGRRDPTFSSAVMVACRKSPDGVRGGFGRRTPGRRILLFAGTRCPALGFVVVWSVHVCGCGSGFCGVFRDLLPVGRPTLARAAAVADTWQLRSRIGHGGLGGIAVAGSDRLGHRCYDMGLDCFVRRDCLGMQNAFDSVPNLNSWTHRIRRLEHYQFKSAMIGRGYCPALRLLRPKSPGDTVPLVGS